MAKVKQEQTYYYILNLVLGCYVKDDQFGMGDDTPLILPFANGKKWKFKELIDFWRENKKNHKNWTDIHDNCRVEEFQLIPIAEYKGGEENDLPCLD